MTIVHAILFGGITVLARTIPGLNRWHEAAELAQTLEREARAELEAAKVVAEEAKAELKGSAAVTEVELGRYCPPGH